VQRINVRQTLDIKALRRVQHVKLAEGKTLGLPKEMSDSDNESLKRLFGHRPERRLDRGEPLFRQGEPATAVFLITRGRLRMIRHLSSGDRITIHTGRRGELFAEGSLFLMSISATQLPQSPRGYALAAKPRMLAAIGDSPSTMLALLEQVTRSLDHARAMRELRNVRSADDRVLQHLHLSASKDGAVVFDRPLLEVAEDIGLTHEAYYRALATLAEAGAIERMGRTIRLINSVS
jgi:CRP-like cAMP-binding protein